MHKIIAKLFSRFAFWCNSQNFKNDIVKVANYAMENIAKMLVNYTMPNIEKMLAFYTMPN